MKRLALAGSGLALVLAVSTSLLAHPHFNKTVTAKLAFRLSRSLAGHSLRVAVQATDRHGHEQLEPDAGTIRVAK